MSVRETLRDGAKTNRMHMAADIHGELQLKPVVLEVWVTLSLAVCSFNAPYDKNC